MYVLGYIPKENRLYLGDKELNVVSYSLLLSVLEYQTAVMRKDFDTADKVCAISYAPRHGGDSLTIRPSVISVGQAGHRVSFGDDDVTRLSPGCLDLSL